MEHGRSQKSKQINQNFMKVFDVVDVILTSQVTMSHRINNIASENYRITSPSNHCCQISIIVGERPGILVTIHFFRSLRQERVHANTFLH